MYQYYFRTCVRKCQGFFVAREEGIFNMNKVEWLDFS